MMAARSVSCHPLHRFSISQDFLGSLLSVMSTCSSLIPSPILSFPLTLFSYPHASSLLMTFCTNSSILSLSDPSPSPSPIPIPDPGLAASCPRSDLSVFRNPDPAWPDRRPGITLTCISVQHTFVLGKIHRVVREWLPSSMWVRVCALHMRFCVCVCVCVCV